MTKAEYTENIEKLNKYTKLYDEGNPAITDEEWDDLYFACKAYEDETGDIDPKSPTNSVQYDVQNGLKKITHTHPMLSLDKTKDVNVLKKWMGTDECIVMAKMDGLTCSLTYEDGKLTRAETRGNGVVGEDILANALTLKSIPKTINRKGTFIVDGEVICKYDDFEEFSDSFKNPRNFASGSIRLIDSKECARRKLTFVAWDIIDCNDNFTDKLATLNSLGFIVVPYEAVAIDNLEEQQKNLRERCALCNYPIDGLVYRINDQKIWLSKGKTEHHFCGSFAFKMYDEQYETVLLDIEWSVGKTGLVTPVAIFEPVEIDGATITRANMHNISVMCNLLGTKPFVGQKIWVYRANMIIPQIAKSEISN